MPLANKNKLKYKHYAEGDRIYLRSVVQEDATPEYVNWMNDSQVVQFLESRFKKYVLSDIQKYISSFENDADNVFLAIIVKESEKHIGNIKIGPINREHNFADVGIMIGNKTQWGKGYGTEAVKIATHYAFEKLRLHKLMAGCYADNRGSSRTFLKAGYVQEGIRKKKFLYNGKYVDELIFGVLNE